VWERNIKTGRGIFSSAERDEIKKLYLQYLLKKSLKGEKSSFSSI